MVPAAGGPVTRARALSGCGSEVPGSGERRAWTGGCRLRGLSWSQISRCCCPGARGDTRVMPASPSVPPSEGMANGVGCRALRLSGTPALIQGLLEAVALAHRVEDRFLARTSRRTGIGVPGVEPAGHAGPEQDRDGQDDPPPHGEKALPPETHDSPPGRPVTVRGVRILPLASVRESRQSRTRKRLHGLLTAARHTRHTPPVRFECF